MRINIGYKKIFVVAAALFLIFAPVGITTPTGGQGQSPFIPAPGKISFNNARLFSFSINLADASGTIPTSTGAGPGSNTTAQNPNFWSCVSSPATCGVYYVALVVNGVMGLALMAGAWAVKLALQFNDNIFDAPAVQIGFSVSLAIANLGFVLGIIIIAIATIIRNQTYGIKQLLWKLVMMAILVNFGLVITAPIVGFANSMSVYFIDATSPSAATGGYGVYVQTMVNAFQPQTVNNAAAANSTGSGQSTTQTLVSAACQHWFAAGSAIALLTGGVGNPATLYAECNAAGQQTSDPADNVWQGTMALMFDIAFSSIAAFTFIILAILLLIRYLMLGGLLIVLPLAWLTYVFPKFDNSFSKWWNTFVKWVFFPPLALFFIYLAFTTAAITASTSNSAPSVAYTGAVIGGAGAATADTEVQGLTTATGIGGGIFAQAADEVLLVGLMVMGLLFALSLSGKAGSTVVNGAKTASLAVGGYVGKKGMRVAGRAVPQKLKENLQAGRIPLVPQRLQVAAGVGLGTLERKGRGDMVAEEAAHAEALAKDPQQFARVIGAKSGSFGTGGTSKQKQMAMLAQLAKDEELMKEFKKQGSMVGGMEMQEFLEKNEGEFGRLQQNKVYDTLKDKSGLSLKQASEKGKESEETMLALGGKAKLQEVKDVQTKKAAGGDISESEKRKLSDYMSRKKDLEWNEAHPNDPETEMTDAEKGELAEMRAMESTSGKYMSDEEKAKYEKAKETYGESSTKIKELVAKDPDTAAATFQDHEKAAAKLRSEGKPVPLSLNPDTARQIQKSIITAMAEGFSPQNAKGLIEAIGKKNNLKYFEDSMDKMDEKTSAQIQRLASSNKQLATWIQNNPGRNIVNLNQMFGIRPKKKKGKDDDEV